MDANFAPHRAFAKDPSRVEVCSAMSAMADQPLTPRTLIRVLTPSGPVGAKALSLPVMRETNWSFRLTNLLEMIKTPG